LELGEARRLRRPRRRGSRPARTLLARPAQREADLKDFREGKVRGAQRPSSTAGGPNDRRSSFPFALTRPILKPMSAEPLLELQDLSVTFRNGDRETVAKE
jgi:hypothetical protein